LKIILTQKNKIYSGIFNVIISFFSNFQNEKDKKERNIVKMIKSIVQEYTKRMKK
jgi:hypothetical protein